jgi:hypothetical protein
MTPPRFIVCVAVVLCLGVGPLVTVAHAQGLGPAFPAYLRDKVSGVVFVPPPGRLSFQGFTPETFGTDVLASPVTTNPQDETTAGANRWFDVFPSSGRFRHNAAFNDYRAGDSLCGASITNDGGATYLDAGTMPLIPSRPDLPVAGDPNLAWSLQGFVYYACLFFSRSIGNGTVAVSTSSNGGASYPAPVVVAMGSSSVFNDKEALAVDTNNRSPFVGRLYTCWTQFTSTADIFLKRSQDSNSTWIPSSGVQISTPGTANQGCDVAVGPKGDVYVVWLQFTSDLCNGELFVRQSTNGGVSFKPAVDIGPVGHSGPCSLSDISGAFRINGFPRIATDRQGDVFVAFTSDLCYLSICSTGLDAWLWRAGSSLVPKSPAFVQVNGAGGTTGDQFFPAVLLVDNTATPPSSFGLSSSHGRVHYCYMSLSQFTASEWDTVCVHSDSPDGPPGTWITPVRVSDCSSFGGFFGGPGFIGDYIGVTYSQGTVAGTDVAGAGHIHPYFPKACTGVDQDVFGDSGVPTAPTGVD